MLHFIVQNQRQRGSPILQVERYYAKLFSLCSQF